jgi:RNA polymerase sigma-70 factor (ECF subfamily)
VPIETFADLDVLGTGSGDVAPDRAVIAREELRVLQDALDRLPPRAREAIVLRQIEGLSLKEIALRMNIAEKTVERHITIGLKGLADYLYGGGHDLRGLK